MGVEERSDGVGVPREALQRVGGYNLERPGTLDGGFLGGSLQLPEGGQEASKKIQEVGGR